MKERLFSFGKALWGYANTNVGSIVVGAAVSHILTKGSREEELLDTKYKLDKTEEKLSIVENRLQESEITVSRLTQSGINTKFDLQNCLREKDNINHLYNNSFCLFKRYDQNTQKDKVSSHIHEKGLSGGK